MRIEQTSTCNFQPPPTTKPSLHLPQGFSDTSLWSWLEIGGFNDSFFEHVLVKTAERQQSRVAVQMVCFSSFTDVPY